MSYPPNPDPYAQVPPQQFGYPPPAAYTQAPPAYTQAPPAFAGWFARVGAYLIDSLVVVPFYVLAGVLGSGTDDVTGATTYNPMFWVFYVAGLGVQIYNRWILAGKTGQSWGRKALGIRLVGASTGRPIGGAKAFGRDICHFVDGIICYIGFLFPLWDAKKQTIADKIVNTVVVR